METDVQQTPFLKQLVDSDEATRDRAFASLRTYLASGRDFTQLELLQLWKGLYYSLYHTPLTASAPLLSALWSLTLAVPASFFVAWARAFWLTMGAGVPQLDAHRLDKFLALQRRQLHAQLTWLARAGWPTRQITEWIALLQHPTEGPLGIGGPSEKIGDGVRYHVLDVLVDELVRVADAESHDIPIETLTKILEPVRTLATDGTGKILRKKAREVLEDDDVKALLAGEPTGRGKVDSGSEGDDDEDEEWEGLDG